MAMIQSFKAAASRIASAAEHRMTFSSLASSIAAPPGDAAVCGRGDKKTKKGKRFKGSFGNSRPKKEKKIERIKDKIEVPRSTPWPLPFKLI
ncbi:30S ribosomal protein S31, mitochondrial-like [Salvia splendens]|uniref:30S ribosomal protein S31, mitochondrial-like n=1 Tax=Salvia splendens TaxID=180675 RepID=UPI001102F21E|nr:30S ribosomal protein S31, mitochondrial-like [Salvia splendens]